MNSARIFATLIAMIFVLAACAGDAPDGFRDTSQHIGATTRFDPVEFAGDWRIVARFDAPPGGTLRVTPTAEGVEILSVAASQLTGSYREGARGELLPVSTAQEPVIVMWVDADFETAAIGTASGSFGAVIDRDGLVPADRATAARDILTFYGWDTTALQGTNV